MIALFREKGWRPAFAGQLGLIHVLWRKLETAKVVYRGDEQALTSFVEHYTGRDDLKS